MNWVLTLLDGLLAPLNEWVQGVFNFLRGLGLSLLAGAIDAIPEDWGVDVATVVGWLEVANAWFPLDYLFELLIMWLAFKVAWWVFRWGCRLMGLPI